MSDKALNRTTPKNIIVEPQIMMMEITIQNAIKASAQGDVIAMLQAYEALKGYKE